MTLSASELSDVIAELEPQLRHRPVQKIVQPDSETVLLGLKGGWLLISASARLGRLSALEEKPPGTGQAAPAFCMLLRKELIGARLESMAAVVGERAAELVFARAAERRRLRLYLFGRSAQLVLTDEAASPLGAIGPARSTHTALPDPRPRAGESRFGSSPGISARIEAHYRREAEQSERQEIVARALGRVSSERKRLRRLIEALERDRSRATAAGSKRKQADLILAHLSEIPRGAPSVTLADDFEEGRPIVIALDPARSPSDNATRMYKEHSRLSRAVGKIDARLSEVRLQLERIEERGAAIERGALDALEAMGVQGVYAAPKRGGRNTPRACYREFRAQRGGPILVGRGADRNDELTFKVARGSDLWLHTRDVPGAHVVVPLSGGRNVDEETLVDAATLAAYHSNARDQPQVDVSYTLRKNVRKPRRAPKGAVSTSATKTLRVRIEPERLARLLASRIDEKG